MVISRAAGNEQSYVSEKEKTKTALLAQAKLCYEMNPKAETLRLTGKIEFLYKKQCLHVGFLME